MTAPSRPTWLRVSTWVLTLSAATWGVLELHMLSPDRAIALFDALGGWAAGIGALVAGSYVWSIWREQQAMVRRDRNAEAVLLEAYLATDIVIWYADLEDIIGLASAAENDSLDSYKDLVERIKLISVDAFRAQLPSLWRMANDFGPAIALALSSTVRLQELGGSKPSGIIERGLLKKRALAVGVLAKGARQALERPHDMIQSRWGAGVAARVLPQAERLPHG